MLGAPCCSPWVPCGLDGDYHGLHFGALGLIGSLLGGLWVACELHWVRQGVPMSYLALLCGRERQIEGPRGGGGAQGPRREIPCGPLLGGAGGSCGPYRRIVDQILHHPALAAAGMSHPGLGCWRHGSSWPAWAAALLLRLGCGKAWLILTAGVSHARRSGEVGGYI